MAKRSSRTALLGCTLVGALLACTPTLDLPGSVVVICATAADCPAGLVCVEGLGRCIPPGTSCIAQEGNRYLPAPNGNQCSSEGGPGLCRDGLCVAAFCGDGVVQAPTEDCDDANDNANDGCNDCRSNRWSSELSFGLGPSGQSLAAAELRELVSLAVASEGVLVAGYGALRPPPVPPFGGPAPAIEATYGGIFGIAELSQRWFAVTASDGGLAELKEDNVANLTSLGVVTGLAKDRRGNVYAATASYSLLLGTLTSYAAHIVKVDQQGRLTVVAGTQRRCDPLVEDCGENVLARAAILTAPAGMAVDTIGRLYFVDGLRVRRIDGDGLISTVAGNGQQCTDPMAACGDGVDALSASFIGPLAIALDASGGLVIADAAAHRIRQVRSGIIAPLFGDGTVCADYPACVTAGRLAAPTAVAWDGDALLVADNTSAVPNRAEPDYAVYGQTSGGVIRRLTLVGSSVVDSEIVVGTGALCDTQPCGDGGPASSATTGEIRAIAIVSPGRVAFIDDSSAPDSYGVALPTRVRVANLANDTVAALAGRTSPLPTVQGQSPTSTTIEGVPLARFDNGDLAFAQGGQVFRVDLATRSTRLLAGARGGCVSDCPASGEALGFVFGGISDLAVQGDDVYVAAQDHLRVYVIEGGAVRTVFGNGTRCPQVVCPDVPDARDAQVKTIGHLAIDGPALYITDPVGNTVWQAALPSGAATRIAGDGSRGALASPVAALASQWKCPLGITRVGPGAVAIADVDNCAVRRVEAGVVTTLVTSGACPDEATIGSGTCGSFASANPAWVPFRLGDDDAGLAIATTSPNRVFRFANATLTEVAGSAVESGWFGLNEGALATQITFDSPIATFGDQSSQLGLAARAGHELLISHGSSVGRLVKELTGGRLVTVVGGIDGTLTGSFTAAKLIAPRQSILVDGVPLVVDAGFVRRIDAFVRRVENVFGAAGGYPLDQQRRARFTAPIPGLTAITAATPEQLYLATEAGYFYGATKVSGDWTVGPAITTGAADGPAQHVVELAYLVDAVDGPQLFASDDQRHVIDRVDLLTGERTPVIGVENAVGFGDDRVPPGESLLDTPRGLAVSPAGRLYFVDKGNHRVRRLIRDDSGALVVETVIGFGAGAASDDGAPARNKSLLRPEGLAFDSFGNLIVATSGAVRVVYARDATPSGEPDGDSTVGTLFVPSAASATAGGILDCLRSVVPAADDTIFVIDGCSGAAVELTRR